MSLVISCPLCRHVLCPDGSVLLPQQPGGGSGGVCQGAGEQGSQGQRPRQVGRTPFPDSVLQNPVPRFYLANLILRFYFVESRSYRIPFSDSALQNLILRFYVVESRSYVLSHSNVLPYSLRSIVIP